MVVRGGCGGWVRGSVVGVLRCVTVVGSGVEGVVGERSDLFYLRHSKFFVLSQF